MPHTQRAHKRFELHLSAEVSAGARTFTAVTRNLSAGGCCLESAHPLSENAELGVNLFLVVDGVEDERMPPLAARGTVQWVAETDDAHFAAGIKFVGLNPAQTQWLEQFLTRSGQQ